MVPLEDCEVITRVNLNLRAMPAGEIIDLLLASTREVATARTPNWFHVEHQGQEGWISAHFIYGDGECG